MPHFFPELKIPTEHLLTQDRFCRLAFSDCRKILYSPKLKNSFGRVKSIIFDSLYADEALHPAWQDCGNTFTTPLRRKRPPPIHLCQAIQIKNEELPSFIRSRPFFAAFLQSQAAKQLCVSSYKIDPPAAAKSPLFGDVLECSLFEGLRSIFAVPMRLPPQRRLDFAAPPQPSLRQSVEATKNRHFWRFCGADDRI